MHVNMNIININSGTSGHFDCENVTETARSIVEEKSRQSGKFENQIDDGIKEKSRRKRKTRRFKSRFKGKNESNKKSKYSISKKMRSRMYPQSEAPYNTNQFLMADHNNVENLDDKLAVPNNYSTDNERTRVRESSFTSADSEDGQFYSSPEDEDEFLTKDFDNTYQSVCAEKFGNLSKAQLTKIIFELEAKVEELSKKIVNTSKLDEVSSILLQESGIENKGLRTEIKDIFLENERLKVENEELKQFIKENAVTSTSSSSSSSSDDSDSNSSGKEDNSNKSRTTIENQKSPLNVVNDTT